VRDPAYSRWLAGFLWRLPLPLRWAFFLWFVLSLPLTWLVALLPGVPMALQLIVGAPAIVFMLAIVVYAWGIAIYRLALPVRWIFRRLLSDG
jgi:hypothetical protein